MGKLLNLEDQFTFYASPSSHFPSHLLPSPAHFPISFKQASYHTNHTNVLIHVLCVPMIFFTALILTHGIPGASQSLASINLDLPLGIGKTTLDLTFPFLYAAANATYFILLEPMAGVSSDSLSLSLCFSANSVTSPVLAALRSYPTHSRSLLERPLFSPSR